MTETEILLENNFTKEENIKLAKFAEQTEAYEDMLIFTRKFIKLSKSELSLEERTLFSNAYKTKACNLRAEIRAIISMQQNILFFEDEFKMNLLKKYKSKISKELERICEEVLNIIDHKFKKPKDPENLVFFEKTKADYFRYFLESSENKEKKKGFIEKSLQSYKKAEEIAFSLKSTNLIKLGLFLNFAVFYYENLLEPGKAILLLRKTLNEALESIADVKEEDYKDVSSILQFMRDNLTLWTNDECQDKEN